MNACKRIRLTHKYCPHCEKECNIKTYKDHKRLFFNHDSKSWYCEGTSSTRATDGDGDSSSLESVGSHDESERESSPPLFADTIAADIHG